MTTPVSVPSADATKAAAEHTIAALSPEGLSMASPIPVYDAPEMKTTEAVLDDIGDKVLGGGGGGGAIPAGADADAMSTEPALELATTPVVPSVPGVQVVAHELDDVNRKEFRLMFPDAPAKATAAMRLVTLTLKTKHDQATFSSDVIEEREALLDQFHERASAMVDQLVEAGYWANYVDPSSGIAQRGTRSVGTFFESDDRYEKYGFEQKDFGCCKAIAHPVWGTRVYVGAVFTDAPKSVFTV